MAESKVLSNKRPKRKIANESGNISFSIWQKQLKFRYSKNHMIADQTVLILVSRSRFHL